MTERLIGLLQMFIVNCFSIKSTSRIELLALVADSIIKCLCSLFILQSLQEGLADFHAAFTFCKPIT